MGVTVAGAGAGEAHKGRMGARTGLNRSGGYLTRQHIVNLLTEGKNGIPRRLPGASSVDWIRAFDLAQHPLGTAQVEKANTTMTDRAYNVVAKQITTAKKGVNAKGTAKITFRAKLTVGGREIERTVVAQGAAAALISGKLRKGNELPLRVLFERAPANEDGKRGGEFLTVVGEPRAKAA
jgi:hypothetical protein